MSIDDRVAALEGAVKILLGVVYQDGKIKTSEYRMLYDGLCSEKPTYAHLGMP